MYEDIFRKEFKEIDDLQKFIDLSKEGKGHVYQLHRELGVAYVDLLFEKDEFLYIYKIDLVAPVLESSELKWDHKGFPYEVEYYSTSPDTIDTIEVKLYRDFSTNIKQRGMIKFLEDVALECLQTYEPKLSGDTDIPIPMTGRIGQVRTFIHLLDSVINDSVLISLDDIMRNAITSALGFDLWELVEADNRIDTAMCILAEYMLEDIKRAKDIYYETKAVADKERREIFSKLEQNIIKNLKLEEYGFKKGFVVIKR